MKYTPRKRTLGRLAKANDAAHRRDWQAILARQNWTCAGCGARDVALQDAHLAGRPGSGATLGPWANAPELRVALCCADPAKGTLGCHERLDRGLDPALQDRLRRAGAEALAARINAPECFSLRPSVDPLDAIRYLVRLAEERHIPEPGEDNS